MASWAASAAPQGGPGRCCELPSQPAQTCPGAGGPTSSFRAASCAAHCARALMCSTYGMRRHLVAAGIFREPPGMTGSAAGRVHPIAARRRPAACLPCCTAPRPLRCAGTRPAWTPAAYSHPPAARACSPARGRQHEVECELRKASARRGARGGCRNVLPQRAGPIAGTDPARTPAAGLHAPRCSGSHLWSPSWLPRERARTSCERIGAVQRRNMWS
jgi:hypothetical protein